ncbi:hypothetical protein D5071_16540 [Pectobacterium carotovorum]|uniref:Uncharacterized protein n=1 Tax=Pectobacterium carotovorum TaxID=554 RepID=A0A419ASZ4_PECCA|nr:hypothetical protein D5071_16540 [Pectobacterium carotovorum]
MFVNYFLLINFLQYRNISRKSRIIRAQCFLYRLFFFADGLKRKLTSMNSYIKLFFGGLLIRDVELNKFTLPLLN